MTHNHLDVGILRAHTWEKPCTHTGPMGDGRWTRCYNMTVKLLVFLVGLGGRREEGYAFAVGWLVLGVLVWLVGLVLCCFLIFLERQIQMTDSKVVHTKCSLKQVSGIQVSLFCIFHWNIVTLNKIFLFQWTSDWWSNFKKSGWEKLSYK